MDPSHDIATEVCRDIVWTAVHFRKESDKALAASGLAIPHFHILQELDTHGTMPLSELSKRLWVSCANITGLVDKLVDVGCVERAGLPEDRRVILAELTAKGADTLRELQPLYGDLVVRLSAALDETELTTIHSLLAKMRLSLEEESGGNGEPEVGGAGK